MSPIWSCRANTTLSNHFSSFNQDPHQKPVRTAGEEWDRQGAAGEGGAESSGSRAGDAESWPGSWQAEWRTHCIDPVAPHRQGCNLNRLSFSVKIRKLSLGKGRALPKAELCHGEQGWRATALPEDSWVLPLGSTHTAKLVRWGRLDFLAQIKCAETQV